MNTPELDELIARAVDSGITADEADRLLQVCRHDRAVLERLTLLLSTDRLLQAVERDPDGSLAAGELSLRLQQERLDSVTAPNFVPTVVERARSYASYRWQVAAVVFVALVTLAVFLAWRSSKSDRSIPFAADGPPSSRANTEPPIAVLKRAVDVRWSDSGDGPAVGAMLSGGWLRLLSGTLQIELFGGARLLVAGPAELRLDADTSAHLRSGKIRVYVPRSARSFSLDISGLKLVELGTTFGVEAADGSAEVHVFDGGVSIERQGIASRMIKAGQAIRLVGTELKEIDVAPDRFPTGEDFAQRAESAGREKLAAWQEANQRLAADPASLVSYSFDIDNEWDRAVTNEAVQVTTESHGALVGAGWTTGRWPGKRGLEFRSIGDRVRFAVPGEHRAITLLAWLRVDSLPNDYNSLILPSRYQRGSLHWTLERGGELRLTMFTADLSANKRPVFDGPVSGLAMTNMDFGRWLFIVTTYDAGTGMVNHYRDGQLVGQGEFAHKLPAVIGPVEFGNWGADGSTPDSAWFTGQAPNQKVRNFVGRIDEMAILARVLGAEEIAKLYEAGRP